MRDDLGAPALLAKQSLEQIGGADHPAMAERETQMRNARLEVVIETRHRRGQVPGVSCRDVVAQQTRQRRRSRLVTGRGARLELRPDVVWHLALQVSHLVRQAALTKRARPWPIAVAIARSGRGSASVVIAPQGISGFAFQRFLDDQPCRPPHQLRAPVRHLAATFHQRLQLLACPIRCGYPRHWGAPSLRPVAKPDLVGFAYQARVYPNPFSSKLRTSPATFRDRRLGVEIYINHRA